MASFVAGSDSESGLSAAAVAGSGPRADVGADDDAGAAGDPAPPVGDDGAADAPSSTFASASTAYDVGHGSYGADAGGAVRGEASGDVSHSRAAVRAPASTYRARQRDAALAWAAREALAPLLVAAVKGHAVGDVASLLARGADPRKGKKDKAGVRRGTGDDAHACYASQPAANRACFPSFHSARTQVNRSPLHYATRLFSGDGRIAALLRDALAASDALLAAAAAGNAAAATAALGNGAHVHATNDSGEVRQGGAGVRASALTAGRHDGGPPSPSPQPVADRAPLRGAAGVWGRL